MDTICNKIPCIKKTQDPNDMPYRFNKDFWNYKEFTRIKDARKYINSIKKTLIGKKLSRVLFLDCLTDYTYVFDKGLWHFYSKGKGNDKGSWGTYDVYWENVADAPILLDFEGNHVEIAVCEKTNRSWEENRDYVQLGYNTISDVDEIVKCFQGVNHTVRFKDIVGQRLTEINIKGRCNNIEFKFENGYGCKVYWDTCTDYGTEFGVIKPEVYAKIPHRLFAYKKDKNSDWQMEIFTGEEIDKKFIEKYCQNFYKYWIGEVILSLAPDTKKKYKNKFSNLVRYMLQFEDSWEKQTWLYIPSTDKFYQADDIVPEPKTKPEISNVRFNYKIDYKNMESYFADRICEDNLSYEKVCDFEITAGNKKIPLFFGSEYYYRSTLKKVIQNLENNQPSKLYDEFSTNKQILFLYPEKDNRVRVVLRDKIFDGGEYVFDYLTDKTDFLNQLKTQLKELTKTQYSINKRIKQYIKQNNLKTKKV